MDDDKLIKKYFYKLSKNNPSSLYLNDDVFFDKKRELVISTDTYNCLLYTSPSPRDRTRSRMPSSA